MTLKRDVGADEMPSFLRKAATLQSGSQSRSTGSQATWGLLSILIDNEETKTNKQNLNVSMARLFSAGDKEGRGDEISGQA